MTVNNIGNRFFAGRTGNVCTGKKSRRFEGNFLEGVETKNPEVEEETKETKRTSKNMSVNSCYLTSAAAFHETGRVGTAAVKECEVRNISYRESDYAKAALENGCTYKAQVENDTVYIEQKNEDGTVKGYEVDVRLVSSETKDPVEQTALAAWDKVKRNAEEAGEKEAVWDFKEAQIQKLLEDREESGETVSHIVIKPDGSKVLELQMEVGGKEVVKTLQIAPPAQMPEPDMQEKAEGTDIETE